MAGVLAGTGLAFFAVLGKYAYFGRSTPAVGRNIRLFPATSEPDAVLNMSHEEGQGRLFRSLCS